MRTSIGTIVVLSLSHATDSFIHSMRFIQKANCFKELKVRRKFTILSVHPHSKDVKDDDIRQGQYTTCPNLLADCRLEQWNDQCEDVDKIMEGLVSPSPESFRVLHSVMSKINSDEHGNDVNYLGDLKALSSFLVKPDYVIEVYLDSEILKWRLVPRANNKAGVIYPCDCIQEGKTELYHEHNTLQLSRMALDLATKTPSDPHVLSKIHDIARQAEKRLALTMGSDLRGPTSSVACYNFALAGVQNSCSLFQTLSCIGIHELNRVGLRASFQPKHILHTVEKFAACDINGQHALDLYHIAGVCLEKKGYTDSMLIESLKGGNFGFHSPRPLIWLWRFSSRQKKVSLSEFTSNSKEKGTVDWAEMYDTSKPLVVDVGSGMGASLLNLSAMTSCDDSANESSNPGGEVFQMAWPDFNYAGADLNQAMVNFGNGVISRDKTARRKGRVHFLSLSAEDFLTELQFYPGRLALIMINFPSPYRLEVSGAGNSQLPSKHSNEFMVTKKVLALVTGLLSKPDRKGDNGLFLFQTKCEDVAVHVKNDCLSLGAMECVPCKNPIKDINLQYKENGSRPKRVDEWLKATPSAERAEGSMYSSTPLLPKAGRPETEVQCIYENTVVHRCLFRPKTSS